jgi:hypothetical protein
MLASFDSLVINKIIEEIKDNLKLFLIIIKAKINRAYLYL